MLISMIDMGESENLNITEAIADVSTVDCSDKMIFQDQCDNPYFCGWL